MDVHLQAVDDLFECCDLLVSCQSSLLHVVDGLGEGVCWELGLYWVLGPYSSGLLHGCCSRLDFLSNCVRLAIGEPKRLSTIHGCWS